MYDIGFYFIVFKFVPFVAFEVAIEKLYKRTSWIFLLYFCFPYTKTTKTTNINIIV